jgi:iron complex outermembrane receptor protein
MTNTKLKLAAAAIGSTLAALPGIASAQGDAPVAVDLQEITVTARKRGETVQDSPLTLQAFSATQLEDRGVQNLADLSKFTPGLTYNQGTARSFADFSIRGMTQSFVPGDNRRDLVTIFFDGVPYIGTPGGIGSEDLERVEVIRGPQSALFGRATFGGAISMITTTPGDEFKGRVQATAGSYGDYRLGAAVEGPIIREILSGRVLVEGSEFDGFYRNAFGGRLGESSQRYVATSLNFTPTEDFSLKLRYADRNDLDGPAASTLIARWPEHNCGPFPGFTARPLGGLPPGFTLPLARRAFCGELRAPNGPVGINTTTPAASVPRLPFSDHEMDLDHTLISGVADWTILGGHTLTAIASTQDFEFRNLQDFERAPEDRYQIYYQNIQAQDTYELRLTSPAEQRFQWMVGLARLDAEFLNFSGFINGALFGAAAGGPPLPFAQNFQGSLTDSVFASLGFDVTDRLNVSLEARYQEDTITSGIGTPTEFDVVTPATLPRLLLRYELSDQTNLYGNFARGNQPTQGYAPFFQLTPAQQAVAQANGVDSTAPEAKVDNYEIGLKHRSADGRWFANVSLYYLEWIGRQGVRALQIDLNNDGQITLLPAPLGEVFNAVPFAAGDSNTRGVEIDGAVNLTERISVGGNLAYADVEITKSLNDPIPLRLFGITDSRGRVFPYAPELSGAAFAQYDGSWTEGRDWFVRTDATYIGKRYDTIANLAYVPGQLRFNLRAGVRSDKWQVDAFVNNLFDDDTLEASRYNSDSAADPQFFQLVASEAVLPNRRQFGVTATFRF